MLARIDHAGARGVGGFAQRGAHGVAIHGRHGQAQAQCGQQRGRCHAGAQHHGIKAAQVCFALQHHAGGAGADAVHPGVEHKLHPRTLDALAQQLREQAAVARARIGQLDGARQRRLGRQAGLDLARRIGVDLAQGHAAVAQHLQCGLQAGTVFVSAQQHQAAVAGFKVQLVLAGDGLQARLAVLRQALDSSGRGAVAARHAAPAPQPGPVGTGQAACHAQGGLCAHQPQRLAEARQRPGAEQVGRQEPGGGKAGLLGGRAALFKHRDFVAVAGQFVRGGDADNAGAHDGNLHEFGCFWLQALVDHALVAIIFVVFARSAG